MKRAITSCNLVFLCLDALTKDWKITKDTSKTLSGIWKISLNYLNWLLFCQSLYVHADLFAVFKRGRPYSS